MVKILEHLQFFALMDLRMGSIQYNILMGYRSEFSIYDVFLSLKRDLILANNFYIFNSTGAQMLNTGAQMLDSIYHMALKLFRIHVFGVNI